MVREGYAVSRRRACRLVERMGLEGIYRKPCASVPRPGAQKYRYLLRERVVAMADEVWCADITYIPMERGFAYLVAVMDWRTRAVLSRKLSNAPAGRFCLEAFEQALKVAGTAPKFFKMAKSAG
jgi:putative transposase